MRLAHGARCHPETVEGSMSATQALRAFVLAEALDYYRSCVPAEDWLIRAGPRYGTLPHRELLAVSELVWSGFFDPETREDE